MFKAFIAPLQRVFIALTLMVPRIAIAHSPAIECRQFISIGDNYKIAQKNELCIEAAKDGDLGISYLVGIGYGFAGEVELEEHFYRAAAIKGHVPSFLALAHSLRARDIDEAIFWYEKYFDSNTKGYGYAAALLFDIFSAKNDKEKANSWLLRCKESPYADKCIRKADGVE